MQHRILEFLRRDCVFRDVLDHGRWPDEFKIRHRQFLKASTQSAAVFNQTYYIAEAQGGVQWSRYSQWFNGRFFARAGFEYQWWRGLVDQANAAVATGDLGNSRGVPTAPSTDSGGLPVNSGGYTFPTNPDYLGGIGTTAGGASQSGGIADFDLIGFTVGAGFMW